jgi:3'(2'), 5'-bisphosphate nucleotidase
VLPPQGGCRRSTAPGKDASNVPVIDAQTAAALMNPLTALVAKAGAAVLSVSRDRMTISGKADGSPVTEADLASDRIIADGLARLCPDIPLLS